MSASAPRVRMQDIHKAFGPVKVLEGVAFELVRGEVHALMGENGAGKSTLMKVLSGAVRRDAGEIELDGQRVEINSPRDAQALGVRIIYQELTLVPYLTVAENIFLGHEPCSFPGLVDTKRMRDDASQLLQTLGLRLDPDRPVREMGIAQQQMVEVAKALVGNARLRPGEVTMAHRGVLFLDELPEFNRQALEGLRMPLEDGEVRIARAAGSVLLPARFQLVAAMNPCPCGLYGDPDRECGCAPQRLAAYRARISGPLLDRFDLQVDVPRVEAHGAAGEPTAAVALRVGLARQLLAERRPPLDSAAEELLRQAADRRFLSGRGVDRAQRVAQFYFLTAPA